MHTKINKLFAMCIISCLCCLCCVNTGNAETLNGVEILTGTWQGESVEYLAEEILVGLNIGETQAGFTGDLGSIPATVVRNDDGSGFLKLQVNTGQDLFNIIDQVSQLPSVRYAEPNLITRACVIPNDPEFSKQWYLNNTGQSPAYGTEDADIDAPEGWDITTGSTVIRVGVLDTGIPIQDGSLSHPDLDDASRFLFGYDYVHDDPIPKDNNGHGTHVTGIIAAETNNGIGIAGVCWNAEIMAIKVFDSEGVGSADRFRDGCLYAVDNGCQVINYSGEGDSSSAKKDGISYAYDNGVIVCAAVGNGDGASVRWPAAYSTEYSNVIAVAATDHNDNFSLFSNIGPEVTVAAPGGYGGLPPNQNDVYSTMPNYSVTLNGYPWYISQNYGYNLGTSFACPQVAGLVALILSVDPNMTPYDVRELLKNTADDLLIPDYQGGGRINIERALEHVPDIDGDGILNDGDFSGSPLDNPCTGGAVADCDDNCQTTYNPNQEDFDSDGIGDICDSEVTYYVPDQIPTIQEAIDLAYSGTTTILVDSGIYTSAGFCNVDFKGKDVTVASVNGASETIIDCGGPGSDNRGFIFENDETSDAKLIGFTIRNGDVRTCPTHPDKVGGAIRIESASPTIQNCIFENNQAVSGGAISFISSHPTITSCLFINNTANGTFGGAICANASTATISNCTFYENSAMHGGALYVSGTNLTIAHTIIANSTQGYGIKTGFGSNITFDCDDFWSNSPGNIGGDHDDTDVDVNTIFMDPYFCDPAGGDFTIEDESPCSPENSPCGELIGKYERCSPPKITSITPTPNSVDIPDDHEILVCFDRAMDPTTLDNSMFVFGLTGGPMEGITGYNNDSVSWTPTSLYDAGDVITYVLTEDMMSANGYPIDRYVGQFTVEVADDSYGTFDSHMFHQTGDKPTSVFLADINGDGVKDMAVPNYDSDNVSIFLGNGDGTFGSQTLVLTGAYPWDVTLTDFDGDGDMDMATSNFVDNNVAVFLNDGAGNFGTPAYYAAGNRPHPIVAADLDGDNDFDLITANQYSHDISVLLNNGNGTFADQVTYAVVDEPFGLASADMDNDGDLDVIASNSVGYKVSILYNNSDATFAPHVSFLCGGAGPYDMVAADLDGDNKVDLVTSNRFTDNISVIIQETPGSFAAPQLYTTGDYPCHSKAADFDGDGFLDLATVNLQSDDISIFINNGDGTFADQIRYPVGDEPFSVFSTDINNDNRTDLIVANSMSDDVSVYFNEEILPGPQLVSPIDGDSTFSHSITLDWLEYAGATMYEVVVDNDPHFGSIDRTITHLMNTQWLITPNLDHGTYYWKVRGRNATGSLPWSLSWMFKIMPGIPDLPPPSCPVLYTYNGLEFIMENPLLTECEKSGYVDIVTDYYQLTTNVVSNDGLVTFQLRELEDEISTIYDIELITVDHDANTQIACDASGNIFSFDESYEPISAADNEGVDQLELVKSPDDLLFTAKRSGWMEISFSKVGSDPNTGISMMAPPKKNCPILKALPNGNDEKPMALMTLEYEDNQGNWIKHSDIPPRTNLTQEYVLIDNSNIAETIKVRLSWEGPYSVDAIQQFIPSEIAPIKTTLSIENGRIIRAEESTDDISILISDNPIELNIGDVYEFSFKIPPPDNEAMARDYIIKAVGRYQPDYAVFTHLLPDKPQLHGNYPNPFNPTTTLSYSLPKATDVQLEIFNVLGQRVAILVDENQEPGKYKVVWDSKDDNGSHVASGIYFYRLTTETMTINRKMILLK